MDKTCEGCGVAFTPKRKGQKYCCRRCALNAAARASYRRANPLPEARKCEICGRPFEPLNNQMKYCSPGCSSEAMRRQARANYWKKKHDNIPLKDREYVCKACGKTFIPATATQKFCNQPDCTRPSYKIRELEANRVKHRIKFEHVQDQRQKRRDTKTDIVVLTAMSRAYKTSYGNIVRMIDNGEMKRWTNKQFEKYRQEGVLPR